MCIVRRGSLAAAFFTNVDDARGGSFWPALEFGALEGLECCAVLAVHSVCIQRFTYSACVHESARAALNYLRILSIATSLYPPPLCFI
jgi:hypothetical protein